MKKLNINAIRIDGGTQSRVEINNEAVSDYAEAVKVGIEFPPIVVFHDGADHWLADGFHRYHAHKQVGKASIQAEIRDGTVRDAILFSLGANCTHGLRRSNADKRKAVGAMLADEEWARWSDRKIAEACGVSQPFVSAMRKPKEVITVITPEPKSSRPEVITDSTPGPSKKPGRVESDSTPPADSDRMAEAQHTIAELAQENEQLRDKLAVESLMDSEQAKTEVADTISSLREQVRQLEVEVTAVKSSRDSYMRENAELKKQVNYWRRQAERKVAA